MPRRMAHIEMTADRLETYFYKCLAFALWAAYNAIARFGRYKQRQQDELPDQRLERRWFGCGADMKLKALEKAAIIDRLELNPSGLQL